MERVSVEKALQTLSEYIKFKGVKYRFLEKFYSDYQEYIEVEITNIEIIEVDNEKI